MNKLIIRGVSIIFSVFLVSTTSFASYPNTVDIEHECMDTATHLHRLANSNSEDLCTGDLEIAAAYIESAGLKLHYKKLEQALTSIKYGELELKEISLNRAYCAHFSSLIKPVIARVIRISSEIEVLERLKMGIHATS